METSKEVNIASHQITELFELEGTSEITLACIIDWAKLLDTILSSFSSPILNFKRIRRVIVLKMTLSLRTTVPLYTVIMINHTFTSQLNDDPNLKQQVCANTSPQYFILQSPSKAQY